MENKRLIPAYAAIDSGTIKVLSIDLFDTLLWRKLYQPTDIFLLLGRKLHQEGWLIPALTQEGFAQLRVGGEKQARIEKERTQHTTEVTLPEIYWQLKDLFIQLSLEQMLGGQKGIYESDVSALVDLELSLEKNLIQFDSAILKLLFYAHAKNIAVIFVSDTYFEESHIHYLSGNTLPFSQITLFLSCEYGVDKRSGLFGRVIEELAVAPHQILHIGDNESTDILCAAKEGMQTLYYEKFDRSTEEITEREWPIDLSKRAEFLDAKQGDFGISSLRAKILHYCPFSEKKEEHFFWKYGATILGPILWGFIHWIYARCEEMKVTEVFCLMREGRLYANLIKRFAPYFSNHTIVAKQLWVSRLFITHAAMGKANRKELLSTMEAFLEHFTVENFCTYLGVDISQIQKWSAYRHVMLEDTHLRKEFIRYLIGQKDVRKQIIAHAFAKRQRFLKYLSGLKDVSVQGQMTLVDIGWNGTAQSALQQILRTIDAPTVLHGLYLGTTDSANKGLLEGIFCEGYLYKGGIPHYGNAHKKGCFVLEQTATAETGVGTLKDIDSEGKILNSPLLIPTKQKEQARVVQQGIFAFFEYAGSYVLSKNMSLDAHSASLQTQLRSIFLRSMINTTQKEAIKFGTWFHEHGPSLSLTQVIGKNSYYDRFIKDMLPIAAFKENALNWPAAYAAKQSKYLTLTSQALWLKTVPPECFLSEDKYPLKIFVDTGNDFPKKATQTIFLRSNPNRNFYTLAKIFSVKRSVKRIRLTLSLSKAFVRISSLRLIAYSKASPESQVITFFESSQAPQNISCVAGKQINFNTFYTQEQLTLLHPFEKNDIYHIKLKFCCEMFRF